MAFRFVHIAKPSDLFRAPLDILDIYILENGASVNPESNTSHDEDETSQKAPEVEQVTETDMKKETEGWEKRQADAAVAAKAATEAEFKAALEKRPPRRGR